MKFKSIKFGSLKVGSQFYWTQQATGTDTKVEPKANSYGKLYTCKCKTALYNNVTSEYGDHIAHCCDNKTVYIPA